METREPRRDNAVIDSLWALYALSNWTILGRVTDSLVQVARCMRHCSVFESLSPPTQTLQSSPPSNPEDLNSLIDWSKKDRTKSKSLHLI